MEISTEGKRPDLSGWAMAEGKKALARGCTVGLVHIPTPKHRIVYAVQVTHASTLDDIRQQLSHIPE
jgi:hypothetical protein